MMEKKTTKAAVC